MWWALVAGLTWARSLPARMRSSQLRRLVGLVMEGCLVPCRRSSSNSSGAAMVGRLAAKATGGAVGMVAEAGAVILVVGSGLAAVAMARAMVEVVEEGVNHGLLMYRFLVGVVERLVTLG